MDELDGIFAWSLEGLKRVLEREEIASPQSVSLAKERFRERVNPALLFVKESCVLDQNAGSGRYKVPPPKLYEAYLDWIDEAKLKPIGKNNFYEQIYLNFPWVRRKRHKTKDYFFGIGLRLRDE